MYYMKVNASDINKPIEIHVGKIKKRKSVPTLSELIKVNLNKFNIAFR